MHRSALGYLIQAGKMGNALYLYECLQHLSSDGIMLKQIKNLSKESWKPKKTILTKLEAKYFTRKIQDDWRITSYTDLRNQDKNSIQHPYLKLDINTIGEKIDERDQTRTPHTFPSGISSGIFLHSVLKTLDVTKLINEDLLLKQLQEQGFSDYWQPVLQTWIKMILTIPIHKNGVSLSVLETQNKQTELQFYLPINRLLQDKELDRLVKSYDPISSQCPELKFHQVQGMIKGFIDLIFLWNGKYYLVDYKSNWLGRDSSAYTKSAMEEVIMQHRYDLQYQLYTLALHRYLRYRIVDYDYHHHFGGVIYLFLRGVDKLYPGNGILSFKLEHELVEGMDLLFSGHSMSENKE